MIKVAADPAHSLLAEKTVFKSIVIFGKLFTLIGLPVADIDLTVGLIGFEYIDLVRNHG